MLRVRILEPFPSIRDTDLRRLQYRARFGVHESKRERRDRDGIAPDDRWTEGLAFKAEQSVFLCLDT
jgi:hypothetical protein